MRTKTQIAADARGREIDELAAELIGKGFSPWVASGLAAREVDARRRREAAEVDYEVLARRMRRGIAR